MLNRTRTVLLLLLSLLLLTVAFLPGAALADEHADITITEDEPYIAFGGWIAANRGLVRAWLNFANISMTLSQEDGTVVEHVDNADLNYGPIIPFDLTGWGCPEPRGAAVFIAYNFGTLEPGTYTLSGGIDMEQSIHDGLHVCGEPPAGPPLFFDGLTNSLTIQVNPAR